MRKVGTEVGPIHCLAQAYSAAQHQARSERVGAISKDDPDGYGGGAAHAFHSQ